MLDRMVHATFSVPLDGGSQPLSADCQELLRRMLTPDPKGRMHLEHILQHPWFLANLPPDAASMNQVYLTAASPPSHQSPGEIQALLAEARTYANSYLVGPQGPPSGGGAAEQQRDDRQDSDTRMAADSLIDHTLEEMVLARSSEADPQVQRYIQEQLSGPMPGGALPQQQQHPQQQLPQGGPAPPMTGADEQVTLCSPACY